MNLKYANQKSSLKLIILLLLFAAILSIIHMTIEELFFHDQTETTALENAVRKTDEREKVFQKFLADSKNSLLFIRDSTPFKNYLDNNSNADELENLFLNFSKIQPSMKQLRFIDKNGYEKIKADKADRKAQLSIVTNNKLEKQSNRYYFEHSKINPLEKVWFTNIELDDASQAVFSAILPVQKNHEFAGIIIIDFFIQDFLDKFLNIPLYDTILCDAQGYPLIHYDSEKNWGRYQAKQFTISNDFPDTYQEILNATQLQKKHFVSKKLDIPESINGGLYLIFQLKQEFHKKKDKHSYEEHLAISVAIFIASLVITYILVSFFSKTIFNLNTMKELNNDLLRIRLRQKIALHASHIGIWECEIETRTLTWDPQMYTIYGLDPLTASDLCHTWRHSIDPLDSERVMDAIHEAMISDTDFKCSFWIITPDGKRRYIRALGVHEYDENGKSVRLVGTSQDLTELKEKEAELKEKETLLLRQSRSTALGEMLSMIAHQWRQPINAISTTAIGINYRLELGEFDSKTLPEQMNFIHEQCQKMSTTINDFMDFSNPNQKKDRFSIIDSINSIFHMVKSQFDHRKIDLKVEHCEDIDLYGAKNELEHVLINLLSNARDAFDNSATAIKEIHLYACHDQSFITIQITDNAGGIPEEIIEKIFDPYFTTKDHGKGTGIGLYMSKIIIEKRFKGTIHVVNKDQGACFIIRIPIASKDDSPIG